MEGKSGTTLLLHDVPGVAAERVLLVGLGAANKFGAKQYREAIAAAMRALAATGAGDAALYLDRARSDAARRRVESRTGRDGRARKHVPLRAA